jgi:hypothetical protein
MELINIYYIKLLITLYTFRLYQIELKLGSSAEHITQVSEENKSNIAYRLFQRARTIYVDVPKGEIVPSTECPIWKKLKIHFQKRHDNCVKLIVLYLLFYFLFSSQFPA